MAGNVLEWTRSLYRDYEYDPDDGREKLTGKQSRVLRGGAFFNARWGARCECRGWDDPFSRLSYLGFRVVASPFGGA